MCLKKQELFLKYTPMEKMLDKAANQGWIWKIIFLSISALAVHMKFLSSFMGR